MGKERAETCRVFIKVVRYFKFKIYKPKAKRQKKFWPKVHVSVWKNNKPKIDRTGSFVDLCRPFFLS